IRLHRAGRRRGVVRLPRGILCRAETAAREHRRAKAVGSRDGTGHRQGRSDHRQAAPRAHGHREAPVHAGVQEVRQPPRAGAPAGSPGLSGVDDAEATALLTIDLDALIANYRSLRDLSAPAECAAVVKADAYGLGMAAVAPALARAGCKTFFVATLAEAEELRALLAGATIYVLAGLQPDTATVYRRLDLRPVLNSADEIDEWAAFSKS